MKKQKTFVFHRNTFSRYVFMRPPDAKIRRNNCPEKHIQINPRAYIVTKTKYINIYFIYIYFKPRQLQKSKNWWIEPYWWVLIGLWIYKCSFSPLNLSTLWKWIGVLFGITHGPQLIMSWLSSLVTISFPNH